MGIAAVARMEGRRLLRSRTSFTLLLLVPLLQVLLFGLAIRTVNPEVRVAIAAVDRSDAGRVAESVAKISNVRLTSSAGAPGTAEHAVRSGQADIGIELPEQRGPANPFAPPLPPRILADSAEPLLTEPALLALATAYWEGRADQAGNGGIQPVIVRLHNPEVRSDWSFLPALIGVVMMISMVMLGCLSLARERESGAWETLLSLPIGRLSMLLGKGAPYVVIGCVQGLVVLAVAGAAFDLPLDGSIGALILLMPPFAAAHWLIGHALAARARTQLEALQGAVAFYLPAMLLSGFLYPFAGLAPWARWIGAAFPLHHFIDAARAATLRGGDWSAVLADGWPVLPTAVVALGIALVLQGRAERR